MFLLVRSPITRAQFKYKPDTLSCASSTALYWVSMRIFLSTQFQIISARQSIARRPIASRQFAAYYVLFCLESIHIEGFLLARTVRLRILGKPSEIMILGNKLKMEKFPFVLLPSCYLHFRLYIPPDRVRHHYLMQRNFKRRGRRWGQANRCSLPRFLLHFCTLILGYHIKDA